MKNKDFKKGIGIGVVTTFCVLLIFNFLLLPYISERFFKNGADEERSQVISEINKLVDDKFLYNADKKKMNDTAIKGYVMGLEDKYAQYFTPEEFKMFNQASNGKYYGIGITIGYDNSNNAYKIEEVSKGYGAEEAGMKVGSYIIKINGTAVSLQNINELLLDIKKKSPGDKVKFELMQDGKNQEFEPVVKEVTKDIVTSKMISDVVYIKISEFDNLTHSQMMSELNKYDKFKGIIIDLRDNPGGDLQAVIDVTSEFLPHDKVITFTEDNKKKRVDYKTTGTAKFVNIPICVLVNENSASASELFTGAIKSYERGKIIGRNTFGKGVVQEIVPLSNGGAFKQTTMRYYTPDGINIDKQGIKPDINIEKYEDKKNIEDQPEIQESLKALGIIK